MLDQLDALVAKLRLLSRDRQTALVSHFSEIATAVADFDKSIEEGSGSVGFSFSMTRKRAVIDEADAAGEHHRLLD